jgi:hypothetical protein
VDNHPSSLAGLRPGRGGGGGRSFGEGTGEGGAGADLSFRWFSCLSKFFNWGLKFEMDFSGFDDRKNSFSMGILHLFKNLIASHNA